MMNYLIYLACLVVMAVIYIVTGQARFKRLQREFKADLDNMRRDYEHRREKWLEDIYALKNENEELENKLKNSDSSHVTLKIYFNSVKESFNSACELIKGMEPEGKEKYKGALTKLLALMKETVENI